MARRRVGRVRVDFSVIEKFAAAMVKDMPFAGVRENWALSRKSALHRRKDGTYTLCLVWKSADGLTMQATHRGLRLERS